MAVQTPYVEYIKISRTDELGQDLTPTLEALTQIKLPFTNGVSVTYYIISRTRRNDYFLFSLSKSGNAAPLAADAGTIDYNFTSSISTTTAEHSFGFPGVYSEIIPLNTPTTDPLGFFDPITKRYTFKTYTQKDIVLDIESQLNVNVSLFGQNARVSVFIIDPITYDPYFTVYNSTGQIATEVYNSSQIGIQNFNKTVTIPKENISPGNEIVIVFSGGGGFAGTAGVTFQPNSKFSITSTAESGPTLNTIPEPYLTSRFEGSDCDVLLNNEELYRENPFLQDIDYSQNPNIPVNFNALLSGSAAKGTVPASYYTTQYHAGPRYRGTKNQSLDVNLYSPNTARFSEDFIYTGTTNLSSIQDGTQLFDIKEKRVIILPLGLPPIVFFFGYVPYNPTPLSPGFSSSIVLPNDVDYITPETVLAVNQTNEMTSSPYDATFVNRSVNGVRLNSKTIKKFNSDYSNFGINYEVKGSVTLGGSSTYFQYLGLSLFSTAEFPNTGSMIQRSVDFTDEDFYPIYFPTVFQGGSTYDINAQGTIPADKINNNRNFLAFAIKGFPLTTTRSITVSGLSIKMWATGVPENIGNFGQTSPVTQNDVNIYEYEWGGGTTPEILDWGAIKLGKILQVSSKDLVKTISPSSDVEVSTLPQNSNEESNGSTTARAYRKVINPETGLASYPDNTANGSIPTSSIYDPSFNPLGSSTDFQRSFWLGPKKVSEYSETLEVNNKMNAEISFFPYPNQANAGSNPTIPNTTKILTTEFGVPGISNYGLTSSYGNMEDNVTSSLSGSNRYGFISQDSPYIRLYRDSKVSRLKRDSNGYYQAGTPLKPNWSTLGNQINTDLNNGGRWFITMYNELEWPNGQGDFNSALTSGSLTPYNVGYSTKDSRGNYPKPFHYKGVWEILGTNDGFGSNGIFYILCDENFKVPLNTSGNNPINIGGTMNIGGNIPGNSLGMLIWKARAAGDSEFIMVQDSVTGGVGAGGVVSKFAPDYIEEHFEEITKEYGANTPS